MIPLHIKPTDKVLEIGSGNNPNPRSDVLCDRYIYSNHQRAGEFSVVIDRPMVVADGYALPFKDGVFDYVICSHILEHMENPQAFLSEVVRVGKAGYIEVPSVYAERMFGWDFHLWYCIPTKKGIQLRKKKGGERFGGFFHRLIAGQIWFRRWFEDNESYFNIQYSWKGKPSIAVDTSLAAEQDMTVIDEENWRRLHHAGSSLRHDSMFWSAWMVRRIMRKKRKMQRKLLWEVLKRLQKDRIVRAVTEYLRCIRCHAPVAYSADSIECYKCRQSYPLDNTMPIMLLPRERKKGY